MKQKKWCHVQICGMLIASAAGVWFAHTVPVQASYESVEKIPYNQHQKSRYEKWQIAQRPGKVVGLKKTFLDAHTIRLSWRQPDTQDGFRIYRRKSGQRSWHLIATVKKCRFTDHDLKTGITYHYRVVSILRFRHKIYQGKAAGIRYTYREIVASDHSRYSYTEMVGDMKRLAARYAGRMQYRMVGTSGDGRGIYDIILGNPAASRKLLVVCSIHAREYATAWLGMKQAEYYLENYYGTLDGIRVRQLLQKTAIHIIPMANPDGVSIAQEGTAAVRTRSLRKKTFKKKKTVRTCPYWKANARGVDLNRNFPYQFRKCGTRGAAGFSGKKAASEPETQALIRMVRTLKQSGLRGVVNYHATGSIVFGDCSAQGTLAEDTERMYETARGLTGYGGSGGYHSESGGRGNFREYVLYRQRIPCITLEVGTEPCPVPYAEYAQIWKKNKMLILEEAALFQNE